MGFSSERENLVANAKGKLEKKSLDLIVANDITAEGAGFEVDTNKVILIDKTGKTEDLTSTAWRGSAKASVSILLWRGRPVGSTVLTSRAR